MFECLCLGNASPRHQGLQNILLAHHPDKLSPIHHEQGVKVLVYHQAGKSFSRKGRRYVKKLMHANKQKLKRKYGRTVQLLHMRDCNLAVMDRYATIADQMDNKPDPDLAYKFANRMQLAQNLWPNSPFKKWRYKKSLNRICRRAPSLVK